MSDYLNTARAENFIGRQWLYREVEDTFKIGSDVSGILIMGDPGSGKSALLSQLICSRTSSSVIHAHILGYHLCKYSDKNTQMAGKFVRNLAEMITRRLPEYGYIVFNNSYIQRSFDIDCIQNQDPVGCFEQTILTHLRNLKNEPKENWYIVIDALDECLAQGETSHSIVYLIKNKIPRFPPWLKFIMTSRNQSDVAFHSSKIKELIIDPEDSRNLEDIELFLTSKIYRASPSWLGDDAVQRTSNLVSTLLKKSQGNFLFVKEVLLHCELLGRNLGDACTLPKTLGDLYHSYFERLYPHTTKGRFKTVRRLLELLVATLEPLTQKELFDILRMKNGDLDEEYGFQSRLDELGHFLRYGENNTVTLYHLSLTQWLASNSNKKFRVSKKAGHEMFCDYYFNIIRDGDKSTLSKHILTLAKHIAYGGLKEAFVQKFMHFPSQNVNYSDPLSNRTLLHFAATVNSTDVLELILRHFRFIDCVDSRGKTPAFLAAEHGLVDNLALLVTRGAKVNLKTNSVIAMYKKDWKTACEEANKSSGTFDIPDIREYMPESLFKGPRFFGASLLHAAAHGGHVHVVRFLLDNNASISAVNSAHQTAIELAAENGHVEVVKALYEAGALVDQTALHRAAANNRLEVVKFLLKAGVKDTCLRCDGSFYWLETKRRLQTTDFDFLAKDSCINSMGIFRFCIVEWCAVNLEQKWEELEHDHDGIGEFFDDKHLILCQTALHAAVASGHKNVVSRLISEETNALKCYDYTGRTPLHEAVRRNDKKLVEILLEKQPQIIHQKCNHWQQVSDNFISVVLSDQETIDYHKDICNCGYTPLHLAARYGNVDLGIFLILRGAKVDVQDCSGATPFHVAACHNKRLFIPVLSHPKAGGDINIKSLNGSTPLHSAATCGAVEVIDHLLYWKANLAAVDSYLMTPLHYSILNVNSYQIYPQAFLNDRPGHMTKYFNDSNRVRTTVLPPWLATLLVLIYRGSDIDALDINGRTALQIAAYNGLADAVSVLLQLNASVNKRDNKGKTPLEVACENVPSFAPKHLPFLLATEINDLYPLLRNDEMIVYLLLSYGASFEKCKQSGGSLLHSAIIKQNPYIVQLLLLKGASLACKDSFGRTPLLAYLQSGGEWTDVILKHFNVSVNIECGKPFNTSVFHLLSYRPPTKDNDTFFEYRKCDYSKCKLQKGPMAEAIERHKLKYNVINSCLDAEGFTPLHRAAQGANVVAIRYLLANGANDSILSLRGYDALSLAVLHAEKHSLEVRKASEATIELLRHAIKTRGYRIICDSSSSELTLYHLAAARGLANFIGELLKERKLHQLDVDCPNADGITPMYLAKLFEEKEFIAAIVYNPWEHVINIIKSHGGKMRYPSKDAEYNLIHTRMYGLIPIDLSLAFRPDIRYFVTSLLSLYEKRENSSFYCHTGQPWRNLASRRATLDTLYNSIRSEVSVRENHFFKEKWPPYRHPVFKGLKRCFEELDKFEQHVERIELHRRAYPEIRKERNLRSLERALLNWIQQGVFNLMSMRRKEIFGAFACMKSLIRAFQPLLNGKKLKILVRQYEENPSLSLYLDHICDNFRRGFTGIQGHARGFRAFESLQGYPEFVNERIKTITGSTWHNLEIFEFMVDWPLEIFVNRFFGHFQRYDYLKTLQEGVEEDTYTPLYIDRLRRVLERFGHP